MAVTDLTIQAFASSHTREGVAIYNVRIQGPKGGPPVELFAHEYELGVNPSIDSSKTVRNLRQSKPSTERGRSLTVAISVNGASPRLRFSSE